MPHLMPHLLYVSATEPTAACASISAALRQAAAGDTVLVGRGRYAPSTTGEQFPLYVPPGATLAGEGQDMSIIDGEGATNLSFRPVQAGQSLILLGDGTTLRDLTVANSGGNGVSNQTGARVLIMRNELRQHGQHGLLLSGPQEAVVLDNHFGDNGTKQFRPMTPRPAAGRQGHHIFVQGKSGAANSLVIAGNTMQRAFADGLALVVFSIRVIGGVGFGGYAAQRNRVRVTISHNRIGEAGEVPIFLQGGIAEGQETVTDNTVVAQLLANDLPTVPGKSSVLLNDGLAGNVVYAEDPIPVHTSTSDRLPYQA